MNDNSISTIFISLIGYNVLLNLGWIEKLIDSRWNV